MLLIKGLNIINDCDVQYRGSKNQRLLVELTLMKLCSLQYQEAEKKNSASLIPIRIEIPQTTVNKAPKMRKAEPTKRLVADKPILNEAGASYVHSVHGISVNGEIQKLAEKRQKALAEKKTRLENEGNQSEEELDHIEQEAVAEGWKEFTGHLSDSGRKNLFAVLSHAEPMVNEKNEIVFPLRSKTDESYFNDVRQDLTQFLKGKLSVENLSLKSEGITDTSGEAPEKKFLSEVELLRKMIEQNPQLQKLKELFDLDLK